MKPQPRPTEDRLRSRLAALLALVLLAVPQSGFAVEPDERLSDPALEARARSISKELRCVVCQNQSIDDSEASLAKDLRILVRARLTAGDSDSAVKAYIVARYGDYVLLRPPLKPATYALWAAPWLVLALGGAGITLATRRRGALPSPPGLTAAEEAALTRLDPDAPAKDGAP